MKTLADLRLENLIWLRELIIASGKIETPAQKENLARIESEIAKLKGD